MVDTGYIVRMDIPACRPGSCADRCRIMRAVRRRWIKGEERKVADSNITKRALAVALKALMREQPFAKISINDICANCGMNRKSFYYHFKDKYDLVNWIFYTDFIAVAIHREHETAWDYIEDICACIETDRDFYRKAMQIEGQNSLAEYFRELLTPIINRYLEDALPDREWRAFMGDALSSAAVWCFARWLADRTEMSGAAFLSMVRECVTAAARKAVDDVGVNEG